MLAPAVRTDLAARAWVEVGALLDRQLSPLGMRAIEVLGPGAGDVVIDVGCGAGQSCLQLGDRVGPGGQVIGVDVAGRLIEVARRRAAPLPQVSFIQADAEHVDLPGESADGVFSRFGVMAFGDPVAAFRNLRHILRPSGKLAFVCWRTLEENELDHLPLSATGLGAMADSTPFSFADRDVVRGTLEAAGFNRIVVDAHHESVTSGSLDEMARVLLRVGPLGKILRENSDKRARAEPLLRDVLARFEQGGVVSLRAAVWVVSARRS